MYKIDDDDVPHVTTLRKSNTYFLKIVKKTHLLTKNTHEVNFHHNAFYVCLLIFHSVFLLAQQWEVEVKSEVIFCLISYDGKK